MNIFGLNILRKYAKDEDVETVILQAWNEPHRKFHTLNHLIDVLNNIAISSSVGTSKEEWEALILASFFHDFIYVPGAPDNEELSAFKLEEYCKNDGVVVPLSKEIILSTKKIGNKQGIFDLFQKADCWTIINGNFEKLLLYEEQIFQEFQKFSWKEYKQKRMEFLGFASTVFPENKDNLSNLIQYVNYRKPKIGIYAGSFNPFHRGHLDILEKAEKIFDKVVIAYGTNPEKETSDRKIPSAVSNRENIIYTGLLSTLLKEYEKTGCDVTLIRGLRNEHDLNYEQNMIQFIKDKITDVKVVFLMCDKQYEHLSSSSLRSISKLGYKSEYQKYFV